MRKGDSHPLLRRRQHPQVVPPRILGSFVLSCASESWSWMFAALMGGKEMKGSELRLPYAAYHFSTSGAAVAVATAVTHPLVGSTNIFVKIASGAFSGAIATGVTNPTEVLKVRLQMNSSSQTGPFREMYKIVSDEGVRALWKGVGPAMARASCLTASQLATYDESKQVLLKWTPLEEGFHLHLISSCIAGTVGTLVTAPVDMIKTRLMLQQEARGVRNYRSAFHCAYQVVLTEGFGALYKG
ncbi:hypothetical protein C4D60_Mb01t17830 [Musa balbisiana]|uniref:Mitochondrial carrier protein n=1 Tax=Musa balbisiana TaxID=52838 RepID=A0A4S8JPC0_MUSBA|nr:hypothetical protein C4D60_Mb01t17830 [Musa balbisiana]